LRDNTLRSPLVTVAIPSFNHAEFLDEAIASVFAQAVVCEVFVLDAGSTDTSIRIIKKWAPKLAGWRSHPDQGQAAAINEGIALGTAPFVCWLNSDDWLLPGGLRLLSDALLAKSEVAVAYGRAWNVSSRSGTRRPVWGPAPFSAWKMANYCMISQPASLIRRTAWEAIGGLSVDLHMAMDYDLWWRLHKQAGALEFVDAFVAANRDHDDTKTNRYRSEHYREAMSVVKKHYGRVPLKWWLVQPYAVFWRGLIAKSAARHK
jgi:glycosyltransferase involved in cell wall biosynthesis